MDHRDLGLKHSIFQHIGEYSIEALFRVSKDYGKKYGVIGVEKGELIEREVSRLQLETDERPVIGDWVICQELQGDDVITELLPRETQLARTRSSGTQQAIAANISHIFITTSMNAEFNLNRLERYLVLAKASGVQPTVVLTKRDLVDDPSEYVNQIAQLDPSLLALPVSTQTGEGLDELLSLIQKTDTCVLIGSSGVGKSSLINFLLGEEVLETLDISDEGARGSHTTSNRFLFMLPTGGLIIDSPGLRQVGIGASTKNVEETFSDVEALADDCRYRNCTHEKEEGCAIQAALADGSLSPRRYKSYLKLMTESRYADNPEAFQRERHRQWRQVTKNRKEKEKVLGRYKEF
ncbi:ribosome small subunit-dependent GTPase A [Vibrio spartinae]|uniref:Small ribosomal subunit biogenesis GTPase RsgA n=1 Tax=Vibrio spartinae TaxID=1918945 RepID=A0A1N6M2W8_9VIBR|nr:ribosome small subunit-dependent GTPase A [Vibrio spartinae]QMV12921.1 Putative ribosome biogenesis GTPase RsgA [Vibrio spartinae]SIO93755.1 Putative ribosome biogenesis GTPase RsgA [Vibrio spartinae]